MTQDLHSEWGAYSDAHSALAIYLDNLDGDVISDLKRLADLASDDQIAASRFFVHSRVRPTGSTENAGIGASCNAATTLPDCLAGGKLRVSASVRKSLAAFFFDHCSGRGRDRQRQATKDCHITQTQRGLMQRDSFVPRCSAHCNECDWAGNQISPNCPPTRYESKSFHVTPAEVGQVSDDAWRNEWQHGN